MLKFTYEIYTLRLRSSSIWNIMKYIQCLTWWIIYSPTVNAEQAPLSPMLRFTKQRGICSTMARWHQRGTTCCQTHPTLVVSGWENWGIGPLRRLSWLQRAKGKPWWSSTWTNMENKDGKVANHYVLVSSLFQSLVTFLFFICFVNCCCLNVYHLYCLYSGIGDKQRWSTNCIHV